MKILFICGSLERGKDGVGDYTRRLAAQLIGAGNDIRIVAFNDAHVPSFLKEEQEEETITVSTLRISAKEDSNAKMIATRKYLDAFDPEWLSLQFVPFAFNDKGLPFLLLKQLKNIAKNRKWHIMFHELWVGMSRDSKLKELLWGMTQRYIIKHLINGLKPSVINTQSQLYKIELERLGFIPILLPIFSNIEVISPQVIRDKIGSFGTNEGHIDLVIFGGIHHGAPVEKFAVEVKNYQIANRVTINLIILGRTGKEQERWISAWESNGLKVIQSGELSPKRLSEELSKVRYGIFTTPLALVEKSGSVSAMREHGIHLLCVSRDWIPVHPPALDNPFKISQYQPGSLQHFFNTIPDFSFSPNLSSVAKQFITSLSE